MLTREQHEQIQRDGANARALGRSEFDNPFYLAVAMPIKTSEPTPIWQEKVEAWRLGWELENAMRAAGQTADEKQ